MSKEIRLLEPKEVWNKFADLNAVPRPSKKEERVIAFMVNFGTSLGLETFTDAVGNVIIRKPASKGCEQQKMVTLQSHLDMVHQKNADTEFDFENQGIEMFIDGDWVRAQGTTLGADNGLGVATIMALLESSTITHPALEALFTIDEETGMTGAMGLEANVLQGEILLNLDTEEDDEIDIGCAGGIDVVATGIYTEVTAPAEVVAYSLSVKGLMGGHSGMDIHKGLGNANKIMNGLLMEGALQYALHVSSIDGGSLRNAIPRESIAEVVVPTAKRADFEQAFNEWVVQLKEEFKSTEPSLEIQMSKVDIPDTVLPIGIQEKLLQCVHTIHNGVYAMSKSMEDLVETSNNLARVAVSQGKIHIGCLTRSSVNASKMQLANGIKSTFESAGYDVAFVGDYPGWNPNPDSAILKVLKEQYIKLFKENPRVVACHAGLECGILGQNYPNMDMISIGPTIEGAHSPDERASISSVQKYWQFVKEILKHIPLK